MKHLLFSGICTLAFAPSIAMADWQYTTWGMTADEAITASNGRLSTKAASDKGISELAWLVEGTHEAAGETLKVNLLFSRANGGLEMVNLEGTDEGACSRVLIALRDKGTPEIESNAPGKEAYVWRDVSAGNLVRFFSAVATKRSSFDVMPQACYVQYKPLSKAENGL